MRLSYRGASYNYQPTPVDLIDSGVSGQYRGQRYNVAYPRHVPVPQTVAKLKYRGVAYESTATGGVKAIAPGVHPELAPGERPIAVPLPLANQVRRLQLDDSAKVHLETIRKRLQHRIEVAKALGDETLLRQLEQEMRQFA